MARFQYMQRISLSIDLERIYLDKICVKRGNESFLIKFIFKALVHFYSSKLIKSFHSTFAQTTIWVILLFELINFVRIIIGTGIKGDKKPMRLRYFSYREDAQTGIISVNHETVNRGKCWSS